ncbi:MAG: HIRAN domain-containing protein [Lachnospirales bacterium]
MKDMYITITGFNHYFGAGVFKIGSKVKCIKEPKNAYDKDAIKVKIKNLGKVGYVANSTYTVAKGTLSAGRIYDKVGKKFKAKIMFITQSKIICKVISDEPVNE